ncbi:MAG: hypothetical protein U0797_17085 [Gemmataceae bacterium]
MPRQNRVTPLGDIIATPERGTFFGNRGVLHDDQGHIRRAWQLRRWLICLLEFKGRWRAILTPGRYTELFFLDEATGLAAGHRPCAECRRERYNAFREAWRVGNGGELLPADEIDQRLHAERVTAEGAKRFCLANLDELPGGVFVRQTGWGETPYLVWGDELLVWTPGGYAGRIDRPADVAVEVLTPASTVRTIRAGYVPGVHPTAR